MLHPPEMTSKSAVTLDFCALLRGMLLTSFTQHPHTTFSRSATSMVACTDLTLTYKSRVDHSTLLLLWGACRYRHQSLQILQAIPQAASIVIA